jgi:hypothetical protein
MVNMVDFYSFWDFVPSNVEWGRCRTNEMSVGGAPLENNYRYTSPKSQHGRQGR